MAARGSILKQAISQKILETFPGSFLYNDGKEIRINGEEEGQTIQIKVTLTAAKTAVEIEGKNSLITKSDGTSELVIPESKIQEPSPEEKDRLKTLLQSLGSEIE